MCIYLYVYIYIYTHICIYMYITVETITFIDKRCLGAVLISVEIFLAKT